MDRRRKWSSRFFTFFLVIVLLLGNLGESVPVNVVQAAEAKTQSFITEETNESKEEENITVKEKNWYALGRPMTEEEMDQQYKLIDYYNSFSKVTPSQEEFVEAFWEEAETLLSVCEMNAQEVLDEEKEKLPRFYSAVELQFTPEVRNQSPYGNWLGSCSNWCCGNFYDKE